MKTTLLCACFALPACGASTQTVVLHEAPPVVAVDARPQVNVVANVQVGGPVAGGGGAGPVLVPAAAGCPGVLVQDAGETRSGRALGMAILQVAARPSVELLVDGVHEGRTPLIAVGVDAGPRELRLVAPEVGYDCTMRLHAQGGRRYAISVDTEVARPAI